MTTRPFAPGAPQPAAGLTAREVTLLLTIFEQEVKEAELIEERWQKTLPADCDGDLDYERAFAAGVRTGAQGALTTFRNAIS